MYIYPYTYPCVPNNKISDESTTTKDDLYGSKFSTFEKVCPTNPWDKAEQYNQVISFSDEIKVINDLTTFLNWMYISMASRRKGFLNGLGHVGNHDVLRLQD